MFKDYEDTNSIPVEQDIIDLRKLADQFEQMFKPADDPKRSISAMFRRVANRLENLK